MPIDIILPISMVMAVIGWSLAFRWYALPKLANQSFQVAMQPLLLLHGFRFIGLMFLIPGVTAEPLDPRFAWPAAYGDLLAACLAFLALYAIRADRVLAVTSVAVFNLVGFADLINAVVRGILYTPDGALGSAFWIPMLIVPLLLVTHVYIFEQLIKEFRSQWPIRMNDMNPDV